MWQSFTEGILHITDLEGYDHMLFLLALCAPFSRKQWMALVILATAFTIGHSISLLLAGLDLIHFSSGLVELLIPVTIAFTAVSNLVTMRRNAVAGKTRYAITTAFGLIHGMGFSSYFRMMFDDTGEVVQNLVMFNLGVEAGQLFIIGIYVALSFLFLERLKVRQSAWNIVLSSFALGLALWMFAERL